MERARSVTERALSFTRVIERALSVMKPRSVARVMERALPVTESALSVMERALSVARITQRAVSGQSDEEHSVCQSPE